MQVLIVDDDMATVDVSKVERTWCFRYIYSL